MKKTALFIASLIAAGAIFFSCSDPDDSTTSSDSKGNITKTNGDGTILVAQKSKAISFSTGTFNALAIAGDQEESGAQASVSPQSFTGARSAARSAETDSMIVKIMEDGSMANFISVSENVSLPNVNYIARSPLDEAKEIYIVFDQEIRWWENTYDEEGHPSGGYENTLGQLLCVNEDGSFIDILDQGEGVHKWLANSNQDSIAFDEKGDMYYLAYENRGNNNDTNMIYKFNPRTGQSSQLTTPIQGTRYEKMQISKDGQWIFVKAQRWNNNDNTNYLRAIPTVMPDHYVNLFYTSTNSSGWVSDWYYDDDTRTIYYIQSNTLYSITQKNGTFSKDDRVTLFTGNSNGQEQLYFDGHLLLNYAHSQTISWNGAKQAKDLSVTLNEDEHHCNVKQKAYLFRNPSTSKVQEEQILAYFFAKAFESLDIDDEEDKPAKVDWNTWKADYDAKKYEIRFDKFAEVEGYETLASVTKGKTDADAIKAITDNKLEELLYNLLNDDNNQNANPNGHYAKDEYFDNFYEHNFFADIIYVKETGKLISEDLFRKTTYGEVTKFSSMGVNRWDLFKETYSDGYVWNDDLVKDKEVQADKALQLLAKYCGKEEIDFSLECFKDDPKYSLLYTELKNEDAFKFLDTYLRRNKLNEYFCDQTVFDNRNSYGRFLLKTCFVKDSDYKTSAYEWRSDDKQTIWWDGVKKLSASYQKSLYGVYNNGNTNGLIKIVNEEGEADGEFVEALNTYKISDLISSDEGFYFKSALLDSANEERGTHQILYFNAVDSTCDNLFDRVAQNTELEVVSFSVGGDYLYYCAARGLTVINGKINVKTKDVTTLNSSRKLSQILTVK